MTDFDAELRRFLAEKFLFGEARAIGGDESLLGSGVVDSMGILELIAHLEERYGIKIDDDELVPENLDSIANIRAFLERKLS
jgi:acyl carrier protein